MRIDVKQRTEKWYELRKSKIGSSEIFGLVKYYITENELQNVGINPDSFTEKPYVTAYELYHKFQNPELFVGNPLKREYEMFGVKVEELVLKYLKEESTCEITKGGVYVDGDKIASLDIEAKRTDPNILTDINGFALNPIEDPNYLIEVKGKFAGLDEDKPLDWRHIFQVQYSMGVSQRSWCEIFAVSLINDNQFERGYISAMPKKKAVEYLSENTNISRFYIKHRPDYQLLIELALERFFSDLRSEKEPEPEDFKNAEMIYNIVQQKGLLLGTSKDWFESNQVDNYIYYKNAKESAEKSLDAIKYDITRKMLLTGKMKAFSKSGSLSLNKKSLRITQTKKKEAKK